MFRVQKSPRARDGKGDFFYAVNLPWYFFKVIDLDDDNPNGFLNIDVSACEAPWERQPGEGDKQFTAFTIYLTMDNGDRRTSQVAAKMDMAPATISNYRKYNKWEERALAYDNFVQKQLVLKDIEERRDMKERQTEIAIKMQMLALENLDMLLDEVMNGRVNLSPDQLTRIAETGSKLERLARGEAQEITENRQTMTFEQRQELAIKVERYAKAFSFDVPELTDGDILDLEGEDYEEITATQPKEDGES